MVFAEVEVARRNEISRFNYIHVVVTNINIKRELLTSEYEKDIRKASIEVQQESVQSSPYYQQLLGSRDVDPKVNEHANKGLTRKPSLVHPSAPSIILISSRRRVYPSHIEIEIL